MFRQSFLRVLLARVRTSTVPANGGYVFDLRGRWRYESRGRQCGARSGGAPMSIAEIAAIDQKQHAPHAGMGQYTIRCGAGGEGLAGAHGHLNESARVVASQ